MKTPTATIRRDTRVFISAVSRELGSVRKLVKKGLEDNDYHAVEQANFPPDYRQLVDKLRERIASCDAVIHIAGHSFGAEPKQHPEGVPRRSYTQLEYDLAVELGKPVYVFLTADGFPTDPHELEDEERTRLQAEHRQRLIGTGLDYSRAATREELDQKIRSLQLKIETLQEELTHVDAHVAATGHRLSQRFAFGVAVVVVLVGGIGWSISLLRHEVPEKIEQAQKKTDQKIESTAQETKEGIKDALQDAVHELTNPVVLAERIRKEIHATTEEKINALPDEKGRGRLVAEIEKERDLALGRVDDLIKLIQEGLREGASPVFQRAAEILQKEGTDEALAYLESRRRSTLETARRHADQAKTAQTRADAEKELRNKSLQALVLEVELLEIKLQWQPALELREQVAELAPDWFEARNNLGELYRKLARFRESEPHLQAGVELAATDVEEAIALNNLAQLLQETNRLEEAEPLMRRALAIVEQSMGTEHPYVANCLNNLADLLKDTNRLPEAEPLMRCALAIDEQSYGAEHPEVATDLNNLAVLLKTTNRLAEAEPLYRRALAIDERSNGAEHPDVAFALNNLALLLQATNRLAKAEPLMRRALAIDEQSYGAEHPLVARNLNNLAQLLQDTNRMAEAEPLMRRALAIDERSYGAEHPDVAIGLSNLAALLQDTNRLEEAESLMRRALAIDEQSYGAEHPLVARNLNNLAQLLQDTNRLAEAEPLMRRALAIVALGLVKDHPNTVTARENYRLLLAEMKLLPDEVERRITAAMETTGRLLPIMPEFERLLGPALSVADVLAALDAQYKTDGKPAVYFLLPDQPIAPHLDELFQPNADSLHAAGDGAFRNRDHAYALVYYEESLKLLADSPDQAEITFILCTNRAVALRELGEVEQARDELRKLLSRLREGDAITALVKGMARSHLALCEWRLNDRGAAQREAEESLKAYGDDADSAPLKKQTEQLLADLKENNPLPPLENVDAVAALEQARLRFRARTNLATLPLDQSTLPLLDQMLGPAKSTTEIFEELDRQYREQGNPAIWFLPLSEPISPHLDELLGPIPVAEEGNSSNAK